jgi:hypothetical protein
LFMFIVHTNKQNIDILSTYIHHSHFYDVYEKF